MSKPIPKAFIDFRSIRNVFVDPDNPLYFGMNAVPPSDIINQETWDCLTLFPDSASIQTSSQCGTAIKKMYELIPTRLVACNNPKFPYLGLELLAASEDFESSLFSILHAFYKQSFQSLRSALEFTIKGVALEFKRADKKIDYCETIEDIKFGTCCDIISNAITDSESLAEIQQIKNEFLGQKTPGNPGGWLRQLYKQLSQYPHSNRNYTNSQMWEGIGPVFDKVSFELFVDCYFETVLACVSLIKLIKTDMKLTQPFNDVLNTFQDKPTMGNIIKYLFNDSEH